MVSEHRANRAAKEGRPCEVVFVEVARNWFAMRQERDCVEAEKRPEEGPGAVVAPS